MNLNTEFKFWLFHDTFAIQIRNSGSLGFLARKYFSLLMISAKYQFI
jgi:hypothetical protein